MKIYIIKDSNLKKFDVQTSYYSYEMNTVFNFKFLLFYTVKR